LSSGQSKIKLSMVRIPQLMSSRRNERKRG
jgi:hypothetical protein